MTILASLLVAGGVLSAIVAQRLRRERRATGLRQLLEAAYLEEPGAKAFEPSEVQNLIARTAGVAERAFGGTGLFNNIRSKVERSDWTVSPGEFLLICLALGLLGAAVGNAIGSWVLIVLLGAAGLFGPYAAVSRSVERRRDKFESQFPDVLDLMSASLESGASVAQALELVVAESDDPSSEEFGRVLASTRLGNPLESALSEISDRVGSRDLRWTVQAMIVQARTGGRLADVLRIVSAHMRGREEMRRELRALTAEGRLSAYVLGALPFALAGFLLAFNPKYLDPLFRTPIGLIMIVGTLILMAIAFVVMFRIIKVDF